ncbi:hypothetical protein, partial [Ureibacillus thermosphaericus]|uniref:hypothetical protein n=1 Tax=Ureibacillus thermosphaericus TaxID=51173 RepID=UPI0030C9C6BD
EVTLRETKGGFRRGTEKLPLQAKLSGSSSLEFDNIHEDKSIEILSIINSYINIFHKYSTFYKNVLSPLE